MLHAQYHLPADKPTPQYLSRHYYDLSVLAAREDGQAAMRDINLLAQVADHKSVFFRSEWAHYETARPGTLRLTPNPDRLADLRRDYKEMAPMIFDDPTPELDDIMNRITEVERLINAA